MELTEREALARLINQYHDIVRTAPPRPRGRFGFWRYFFWDRHVVDGRRRTLYSLEQDIRRFGDPRFHFALNCGATSCPPIRRYEGDKLDAQLDLATRAYLSGPDAVQIDEATNTLALSQLFRWYARDFGDVPAFVARHLDEPGRAAIARMGPSPMITYLPWDWTPTP